MGLLLSVLITCVGVYEAVTRFQRIVNGLIDPDSQIAIDRLSRRYDDMFSEALHSSPKTDDWKAGGEGYLHIKGGGAEGPMVASIKYFGASQDTTNILFSTKISSFGQDSEDNSENLRTSESPEKFDYGQESLFPESERYTRKASPVSLWDDEPEADEPQVDSEPKAEATTADEVQESLFRQTERFTRKASPVSFWDDEPEEPEVQEDEAAAVGEAQQPLFRETERYTRKASPSLWDDEPEPEARTAPQPAADTLQPESERSTRNASPSFWDDEPETKPDAATNPEAKEKIKWHYRPLTPTNAVALPEIHFDSYERKANGTDDRSTYSDEFLRSLDGVKFRPLQRDDGTGRRRSYKKRHSSSSNSSRDSKASREEELKIFTSLEEDEFELNTAAGLGSASAPNLSVEYQSKGRSRNRSNERRSRSPAGSPSVEGPDERGSARSPAGGLPHLKDLPKVSSFQEEDIEDEQPSRGQDFALSTLNSNVTEDGNKLDEDSGISFWDT